MRYFHSCCDARAGQGNLAPRRDYPEDLLGETN